MINFKLLRVKLWQKFPLQLLLIGGLVFPLVMAVSLSAYLTWKDEQKAIEDLVIQLQAQQGELIQQHLRSFTTAPHHATALLSRELDRVYLDGRNLQSWSQFLLGQGQVFNSLTNLYYGNQAGDYIELNQSDDPIDRITLIEGQRPTVAKRIWADPLTYPKREEKISAYDPRLRPWYQAAQDGHTQWTDIYEFAGPETALGLTLVRPHYDDQGDLLGVVGADFTLKDFSQFLNGLAIGRTGEAFVIDRDGILVASSSEELPISRNKPLQVLATKNALIQATGKYLLQEFDDFSHVSKPHSLSFKKENQRQLVQVTPFADEFGLDWLIIVVVPETDFTDSIRKNIQLTLLLTLAFLLPTILLAIVIARRINRGVRKLSQASQAIAEGNLGQQMPFSRIQELDVMAQAFNHMSQKLEVSYAQIENYSRSLETKVQERTSALEQEVRDRQQAEQTLQQRAEMDRLFSQISRALIDEDIDTAVNFTLEKLGEFTQSDRCCIFTFYGQSQFGMTHEWCASGIQSFLQDRRNINADDYPWFYDQLQNGNPFQISNVSDLPPEAIAAKNEFKRQSIDSLLNVPMVYAKKVVGVLGLDSVQGQKQWRPEDIHLLKLVGEIIAISQARQAAETSLKQAKEAAEVANKTKSKFLANMSHELRSPLNAILGFAQFMIRSHTLSSEHQENVGIINRSGEHLLSLINDVLDMSKIEAGRTTLNPTNFDLYNLLGDLQNMFRLRAEEKDLTLSFQLAPNLPQYIHTDQGKLRQVLINVLSNAIKFTEAGSIKLSVYLDDSSEDVALPSSILYFEVKDTGPGIRPNELNKVFDPFVQTQTGQESPDGTGLGLPISRKFVELMGGTMTLSSQAPQAQTFAITTDGRIQPENQTPFPQSGTMIRFNIQAKEVLESPGEAQPATRQILGLAKGQPSYRILIVDDKPDNRKLLVKFLKPLGFELMEASNGQEAVECWQSWQPHLIWMDLRMPIMDGFKAAQKIREIQNSNGLIAKIIALSASSFKEDQLAAEASGCDAFIRKPFRDTDIFEVMGQELGVRYLYDDEVYDDEIYNDASIPPSQSVNDRRLDGVALAQLPTELLTDLEFATRRIQWPQLLQIIEAIRSFDEALADRLFQTVQDFHYDQILQGIQVAKESK